LGLLKSYKDKKGKVPGHLYYTGDKIEKVKIEITNYGKNNYHSEYFEFTSIDELEERLKVVEEKQILWINVFGLSNIELIKFLGNKLKIPDLHLEDVLNVGQRPKIETQEDFIFVLLNMINKREEIIYEQVSMFSKENVLVTFQEMGGDVFDAIRDRIAQNKGNVRSNSVGYLLYILLDVILDNYFVLMMNLENSIEELEENVMINDSDDLLKDIYFYKKELAKLRNSIIPLKEVLKNLLENEKPEIQKYYKDLYDHIYFMIDNLNVFREMINGIYEIHISNLSNRMNKIMTVLTIFSAVFIPMTFLAGVYGMNFIYMPGLTYRYGFWIFLVVCIGIFLGMLKFFKNKNWI